MRLASVLCAAALAATAAPADTLVAARTIRPGAAIGPGDLAPGAERTEGALEAGGATAGLVARRLLTAGRPVFPGDVGPPPVVDRNAVVPVLYRDGGLTIATEGRALESGAAGDRIRVMNLGSRETITGVIAADGTVHVGDMP